MTQDVEKFCDLLRQVVENFGISIFVIGMYTYQCFLVTQWIGPCLIYGYVLVSALVPGLLIPSLASVVSEKEKHEGKLR